MAAKFELYKDAREQYRWRLKAANGEVIATSESYVSKSGAMNSIESVQTTAAKAEVDDQTT